MALMAAALSAFVLALLAPLISRFAGRWAGWLLALLPAGLTVYFAAHIADVAGGEAFTASWSWAPTLGVDLAFRLDGLGLLFALLICGIGALIVVYSGGYLAGNPQIGRFYAFLLFFMGSMLGMVLADNLITFFVFWELTSLSSFLLIGFEHNKETTRRAALQALLVTVIGGQALLAGLVPLAIVTGTQDMGQIADLGETVRGDGFYVPILLLMLAGAFTKSAQVPFHFWLPNAMAAPTPVSAYLHSATMVKAGVYLLMRFHPVLSGTDEWFYLVTTAGAVTMVLGAYMATQERDLKRILAYSTISVLGLLTMLLGEGSAPAVKAAVVFLAAHALYKAALFLVAGIIDHETGAREVSALGGLARKMPISAAAGVVAAFSLAGLAPAFSFIGKEVVLEAVWEAGRGRALLVPAAVMAAALLVAVAAIVAIRPFFGPLAQTAKAPREPPPAMWLGPALLAGLGIVFGVFPNFVATEILSPAQAPILGAPEPIDLRLWHGLNAALFLSIVSVSLGAVLYLGLPVMRSIGDRARALAWWAPERWYERGLDGLLGVAAWQTRILQDGYLRHYLATTIITGAGLSGYALLTRGDLGDREWTSLRVYEVAVAVVIVLAAITAVRATSRLVAVTSLGIAGYGIALIYLLFGAPDLAMTQVLVETLTVILFVLIFAHLPRLARLSPLPTRLRDMVLSAGVGLIMAALVLMAVGNRQHEPISNYLAERAQPDAHGRNIVNVILVDFRALDTLGEITVLALAGVGIYALLKLRRPPPGSEE
jgi:multicomponent Na+:H+ antiporter subunit A